MLSATLLPEPVAPATSRCGIAARSATAGRPKMSLPSASGSLDGPSRNSGVERISLSATVSRTWLGISIPIADLPSRGETIRTLGAFIARARSSARLNTLLTLSPGTSSTSNIVMTGPGWTSVTVPSTSKSNSFFSSSREFITSSSLPTFFAGATGSASRDSGGSW